MQRNSISYAGARSEQSSSTEKLKPSLKASDILSAYVTKKRIFDIAASCSLLVFLTPLLIGIWLAVRLTSKGPGIFWSRRIGRHGRIFNMPKFRTMTVGTKVVSREVAGDDNANITRLGHFLRKTSLDELPQLWSVFKGDMSLIGPRALIPHDIASNERAKYPDIYRVRPGMTGLAQIKGRNLVKPRQKAIYDAFYANRANMLVDAWICVQTVIILTNTNIIK